MNKLYHCLCLVVLSSCASSSMGRISIFDSEEESIFERLSGGRVAYPTGVQHVPAQNPGGVEFETDKGFVKSYSAYKKHMRKKGTILEDTTEDTQEKQYQDEFAMYKLVGAIEVDTSKAGWEDYIPPPKKRTILETISDNIKDNKDKRDMFGNEIPSTELLYQKANEAVSSSKEFIGEVTDDIRSTLIEQQQKNPTSVFNYYARKQSSNEKTQSVKKQDTQQARSIFDFHKKTYSTTTSKPQDNVNIFNYYENKQDINKDTEEKKQSTKQARGIFDYDATYSTTTSKPQDNTNIFNYYENKQDINKDISEEKKQNIQQARSIFDHYKTQRGPSVKKDAIKKNQIASSHKNRVLQKPLEVIQEQSNPSWLSTLFPKRNIFSSDDEPEEKYIEDDCHCPKSSASDKVQVNDTQLVHTLPDDYKISNEKIDINDLKGKSYVMRVPHKKHM